MLATYATPKVTKRRQQESDTGLKNAPQNISISRDYFCLLSGCIRPSICTSKLLLASAMTKSAVTILDSTIIRPSRPTEKQLLYLSSLDLMWREIHYNRRLLFYEIASKDYSNVVQKLQNSLAVALVHFFPLAGRLAKGKDGRFAIHCNDEGVEFVEASIDVSFNDLGSNFDFHPYFCELVRLGHLTRSDSADIPLLAVQVTRFLDGGIAIGLSHSHIVADGYSLWHFMVSWGECARGLEVSKPPILDRTAFKPKEVSEEVAKRNVVNLVESTTWCPGALQERVFHFSRQLMGRLKAMAEGAAKEGGGREASGYEVFCAHCWRRLALARGLAEEALVSCVVLANWRFKRRGGAAPPVTAAFFGNAISWTAAVATAGEILSESFPATVARVMAAVDQCTNIDSLEGMIHYLELHDTLLGLDHLWFPGHSVNVASSPRFPAYDVDFGWGIPACVRPARVGGYGGELCLFPRPPTVDGGDDGIDVCLNLHPSHLERLQNDPLFLSP